VISRHPAGYGAATDRTSVHQFQPDSENGGEKVVHGSGGMSLLRAA